MSERVEKTLKEEQAEREKNPNFQNLRDFYSAMKKEGIAIQHPYTLPLIDTIRHSLAERQQSAIKRNE